MKRNSTRPFLLLMALCVGAAVGVGQPLYTELLYADACPSGCCQGDTDCGLPSCGGTCNPAGSGEAPCAPAPCPGYCSPPGEGGLL